MKKLSCLFLVAFITFSCSSDDDGGSSEADLELLVGTWLLISDIDQDGVEYVEEGDCPYQFIITETTFTDREFVLTQNGCTGFEDVGPYPYEISGDSFIVDFTDEDDYEEVYQILELTETRLKTISEYEDEGEMFSDTQTFVRQ